MDKIFPIKLTSDQMFSFMVMVDKWFLGEILSSSAVSLFKVREFCSKPYLGKAQNNFEVNSTMLLSMVFVLKET